MVKMVAGCAWLFRGMAPFEVCPVFHDLTVHLSNKIPHSFLGPVLCAWQSAFFMYKEELRVVQPSDRSQHPLGTDAKIGQQHDLVAYTYSARKSDSPAFRYVNQIVNKFAQGGVDVKANKQRPRAPANDEDFSDASPLHRARRLATHPEIFNGCIDLTKAPYGKMTGCPATTKEIKIGVAHDAGYTKALTGFGTSGISESDAIDRVEEDAIINNHILNVLMGTNPTPH